MHFEPHARKDAPAPANGKRSAVAGAGAAAGVAASCVPDGNHGDNLQPPNSQGMIKGKKPSKQQMLVMEGNRIKARLLADRAATGGPVHVDWLRFTFDYKKVKISYDDIFNVQLNVQERCELPEYDREALNARAAVADVVAFDPFDEMPQARAAKTVALDVCKMLGVDYRIDSEIKKGRDFYKFRFSIMRGLGEVGWVGFLASSDSKKQKNQSETVHVNLYGEACTFAEGGWREKVADFIDLHEGRVTRIDLALDFFGGIKGGLSRIKADYEAGAMDYLGKRPCCNMVGDWSDNGRGRSFYAGSKEAGKQTNIYEKGVQLFGAKDATNWERIELRLGNKLRVLETEILRRPADFFAGASPWHLQMLHESRLAGEVTPERIKTTKAQASECVKAEVSRVFRWLKDVAAPALTFAFDLLPNDQLTEIITSANVPGRLKRFTKADLEKGAVQAFSHVSSNRFLAAA